MARRLAAHGSKQADETSRLEELGRVKEVLWAHHDMIFRLFTYYASYEGEIHALGLNSWTQLLDDCRLVSAKSRFCKMADMDRIFIAVVRAPYFTTTLLYRRGECTHLCNRRGECTHLCDRRGECTHLCDAHLV